MTLKDFAQQCGVSPATARSWKARGKIVERGGEFLFADGLTYPEFKAARACNATPATRPATEGDATLQDVVATFVEMQRDAGATPDLATLQREIATLRAHVATLQADNATLRDRVRSLEMWRVSHGTGPMERAPSSTRPGGAIDPPGPMWGA